MEKIMLMSDSIGGPNSKDSYSIIKGTAAASKDRINGYLNMINKKSKDYNLVNAKSLLTVKNLYKLYDAGKRISDEFNALTLYCEILENIEENIKKLKRKNKELIASNKALKVNLNNAEKELQMKESKLISIKERKKFYTEMISISKYDIERELIDIEYEIWDQCIYDKLNINFSSILKHYKCIVEHINSSSLTETMNYTEKHLIESSNGRLDNEEVRYQKSLCFLLVSKFCYDSNYFKESLKFGMEALHQSKSLNIEKPRYLSKVMGCISLVLLKNNETKKALFYVLESLKLLESISKSDNDRKSNLADQYIKLGYIFSNSSLNRDGIELMELGVISYSLMLPEEETHWVDSLSKLAKVCNDYNFIEDTMIVCEKLIIYFHNKKAGSDNGLIGNKNIFDIAVDVEDRSKNSNLTEVEVPIPISLPRYMQNAVSELVIIFSKNNLFTGASLLSRWLKHCKLAETDSESYKAAKFFIPIETLDVEGNFEHPPGVPINISENKPTLLTQISSQMKVKHFSSKLSSLFWPKANKTQSNTDSREKYVNLKKFNIFKK